MKVYCVINGTAVLVESFATKRELKRFEYGAFYAHPAVFSHA